MKDPVRTAELEHDSRGFSEEQLKPFIKEAIDDLVWRLFQGQKVGGFGLDAYVEKFAEYIAAKLILKAEGEIPEILEILIRGELADSDEMWERAAELAKDKS